MAQLFQFDQNEILTFFSVLVRFSVLIATMPFFGDVNIPLPVKILLSLIVTTIAYPILVLSGQVIPSEAVHWGATAGGIVKTVAAEALLGLALAFTARLIFDAIALGANVAGTFMGFGMANAFDPHQESQTQVIAKFQTTIAMLIFLVMDGHHLMLRAALDSYQIVAMGKVNVTGAFADRLISFSSEMIKLGFQIAAPMAVALFSVHVVYGIIAKAMPQLNILILSFSVSAFVGLIVLSAGLPQFHDITGTIFSRIGDEMRIMMQALR